MKLIGYSIISPKKVIESLNEANLTYSFYSPNTEIDRSNILIFLNYLEFKHRIEYLSKKKNLVIIIFAPISFLITLKNVKVMDNYLNLKLNQPFKAKKFSILSLKKEVSDVKNLKISFGENYLSQLITNALAGSVLTHLMTLLYKIPNSKVQTEYRDKIIGWLVLSDGNFEKLNSILAGIKQDDLKEGIFNLIKDNIRYNLVFKEILNCEKEKRSFSFTSISVEKNVNEFDLHYMLSVASKVKVKKMLTT